LPCPLCAKSRREQVQQQPRYSITSSARVSSAANSLDEIASPRFAISEMEVNDQFALQKILSCSCPLWIISDNWWWAGCSLQRGQDSGVHEVGCLNNNGRTSLPKALRSRGPSGSSSTLAS